MTWVRPAADAARAAHILASHSLNPEALRRESGDAALAEAVASGAFDERMRSLCRYALKLTRSPAAVVESDVEALSTSATTSA